MAALRNLPRASRPRSARSDGAAQGVELLQAARYIELPVHRDRKRASPDTIGASPPWRESFVHDLLVCTSEPKDVIESDALITRQGITTRCDGVREASMKRVTTPKKRAVKTSGRTQAALGFRAHSGWAALVVIAGPPHEPTVMDRRRIEIADPEIPGSKQPYHAAEGLPLAKAKAYLGRCTHETKLLARRAVSAVVADLREKGHDVVGCGILAASGRPLTTLAATLASHALIHTAEGELFRNALIEAGEHCNLAITKVSERELYARGVADLGIPVEELRSRVAELGRPLGPPWTQDEKHAALIGWMVLAAAARSSARPSKRTN